MEAKRVVFQSKEIRRVLHNNEWWFAGEAREKLEIETGDKVVSPENYLSEPESRKRLKGAKRESKAGAASSAPTEKP